jgi:hypothetical protein
MITQNLWELPPGGARPLRAFLNDDGGENKGGARHAACSKCGLKSSNNQTGFGSAMRRFDPSLA